MKNIDGISLNADWWDDDDHKITNTVPETKRDQFKQKLRDLNSCSFSDYSDWATMDTLADQIKVAASDMKSHMGSTRHAMSIKAMDTIHRKAQEFKQEVASFYTSLDEATSRFSSNWHDRADNSLDSDYFDFLVNHCDEHDNYKFYVEVHFTRNGIGMREHATLDIREKYNLSHGNFVMIERYAFTERRSGQIGIPQVSKTYPLYAKVPNVPLYDENGNAVTDLTIGKYDTRITYNTDSNGVNIIDNDHPLVNKELCNPAAMAPIYDCPIYEKNTGNAKNDPEIGVPHHDTPLDQRASKLQWATILSELKGYIGQHWNNYYYRKLWAYFYLKTENRFLKNFVKLPDIHSSKWKNFDNANNL